MIPLQDTVPTRSLPLVTWLLIALNVVMFMAELSADANGLGEAMVQNFGIIPTRFLAYHDLREVSTLITAMFLHGGWFHLFFNMWALYIFGDNVEDRMGPARYLTFYLVCGLAAGLTHIYFNSHSTMPSIGASGAIAGVLGAYLLLFPQARVITLIPILFYPLFIEIPAVLYLGFWFISQLLNGTLEIVHSASSPEAREVGGVAWWAHAGGFITGVLLVWPFAIPRRKLRTRYVDEYSAW
jgi:membrane associated rhomboid family serine protease